MTKVTLKARTLKAVMSLIDKVIVDRTFMPDVFMWTTDEGGPTLHVAAFSPSASMLASLRVDAVEAGPLLTSAVAADELSAVMGSATNDDDVLLAKGNDPMLTIVTKGELGRIRRDMPLSSATCPDVRDLMHRDYTNPVPVDDIASAPKVAYACKGTETLSVLSNVIALCVPVEVPEGQQQGETPHTWLFVGSDSFVFAIEGDLHNADLGANYPDAIIAEAIPKLALSVITKLANPVAAFGSTNAANRSIYVEGTLYDAIVAARIASPAEAVPKAAIVHILAAVKQSMHGAPYAIVDAKSWSLLAQQALLVQEGSLHLDMARSELRFTAAAASSAKVVVRVPAKKVNVDATAHFGGDKLGKVAGASPVRNVEEVQVYFGSFSTSELQPTFTLLTAQGGTHINGTVSIVYT